MNTFCIAIFGEAEKGTLAYPYFCKTLLHLFERLGNPPKQSKGLVLATQNILRGGQVLYFRVRNEGFSAIDYETGLRYLEKQRKKSIDALFLPGLAERKIMQAGQKLCDIHKALFLIEETDLFDYFTS